MCAINVSSEHTCVHTDNMRLFQARVLEWVAIAFSIEFTSLNFKPHHFPFSPICLWRQFLCVITVKGFPAPFQFQEYENRAKFSLFSFSQKSQMCYFACILQLEHSMRERAQNSDWPVCFFSLHYLVCEASHKILL